MKKNPLSLLLLLTSVLTFAGCKKTETNYNVEPKLLITFDDNIDKVTADFQRLRLLNIKVGFNASVSTVRVTSTYQVFVGSDLKPRSLDLGVFPVNAGVVTITNPVLGLRAAADGTLVGAGATPTGMNPALYNRSINSYALAIDATTPDGNTSRRFFTVVATQL